jgi:hypothetical protein
MDRAVLIERIEEARSVLEELLSLLQCTPVARDRWSDIVSYGAAAAGAPAGLWLENSLGTGAIVRFSPLSIQEEYRRTCETAGKSGKQIERCVISSFQIAESMGFKGDFRFRGSRLGPNR